MLLYKQRKNGAHYNTYIHHVKYQLLPMMTLGYTYIAYDIVKKKQNIGNINV